MRQKVPLLALTIIGATASAQCLAKSDIRGVATAQLLRDAVGTLEWDGAECERSRGDVPTIRTYDARTRMTLYATGVAPPKVGKLVYAFRFRDLAKMREKLQHLYGCGATISRASTSSRPASGSISSSGRTAPAR